MGTPIKNLTRPKLPSGLYINLDEKALALDHGGVQITLRAEEPGLQALLSEWVEGLISGEPRA